MSTLHGAEDSEALRNEVTRLRSLLRQLQHEHAKLDERVLDVPKEWCELFRRERQWYLEPCPDRSAEIEEAQRRVENARSRCHALQQKLASVEETQRRLQLLVKEYHNLTEQLQTLKQRFVTLEAERGEIALAAEDLLEAQGRRAAALQPVLSALAASLKGYDGQGAAAADNEARASEVLGFAPDACRRSIDQRSEADAVDHGMSAADHGVLPRLDSEAERRPSRVSGRAGRGLGPHVVPLPTEAEASRSRPMVTAVEHSSDGRMSTSRELRQPAGSCGAASKGGSEHFERAPLDDVSNVHRNLARTERLSRSARDGSRMSRASSAESVRSLAQSVGVAYVDRQAAQLGEPRLSSLRDGVPQRNSVSIGGMRTVSEAARASHAASRTSVEGNLTGFQLQTAESRATSRSVGAPTSDRAEPLTNTSSAPSSRPTAAFTVDAPDGRVTEMLRAQGYTWDPCGASSAPANAGDGHKQASFLDEGKSFCLSIDDDVSGAPATLHRTGAY